MEEILKQVQATGGILVVLVPAVLQILKTIPPVVKAQKAGYPVYEVLGVLLGVGGAYALGIANPIVAGIVVGLAAEKGFDIVKGRLNKPPPQ